MVLLIARRLLPNVNVSLHRLIIPTASSTITHQQSRKNLLPILFSTSTNDVASSTNRKPRVVILGSGCEY